MGETTGISWCDATFNPWWGCVKVSEGCANCYAETFAHRMGLDIWKPGGERKFFGDKHWNEPRKWNRDAFRDGVMRRVFCASMADVFESGSAEQTMARLRLWELIWLTPNLEWLLLTKRPENIRGMVPVEWLADPPSNVRIGTTVENAKAVTRMDWLNRWPGKNFISYEPALEFVDFFSLSKHYRIDWLIIGGESGVRCRPFLPDWARANLPISAPVFIKQLGGHPNKRDSLEDFPADLRIRQFPKGSNP